MILQLQRETKQMIKHTISVECLPLLNIPHEVNDLYLIDFSTMLNNWAHSADAVDDEGVASPSSLDTLHRQRGVSDEAVLGIVRYAFNYYKMRKTFLLITRLAVLGSGRDLSSVLACINRSVVIVGHLGEFAFALN
jgi:hypothetical protein